MKKERITFQIREGETFIPLIQLLKATGIAYSGSEAQDMVMSGSVFRNGEMELRKRAKIVPGDIIEFQNIDIEVIS